MAQSSPKKIPKGKAEEYTLVPLSDKTRIGTLLSALTIATCNPSVETVTRPVVEPQETETHYDIPRIPSDVNILATVSLRMSCNCCSVAFENRHEQQRHFKSDWHRYNLKQEVKGDKNISEEQFEAMTGDLSSISGSDDMSSFSSEEEPDVSKSNTTTGRVRTRKAQIYDSSDSTDSESEGIRSIMASTRQHPKVFLRNGERQLLSLYRCVLYHKKHAPSTPAELLVMAERAQTYTRVAVIMLAGGHFSAAIFDGLEAVVHKTFHRYVVRAKRGTLQSVRDNKGSAPKSGGASLRRYNEAALAQEIQELLMSWSQQLSTCHLVFLRASTYSRHLFFGGKTPILCKNDTRVRTVPFTTGRPTFNEAKRVHHILMAAECFGDESVVQDFVPVSPPRRINPETGHLVVKPESKKQRLFKDSKVKDKNAEGDSPVPPKLQKGTMEVDNTNSVCPAEAEEDDHSGGEMVLVHSMVTMHTRDLREFECSVDASKHSKKKKKKKGSPKDMPDEETATGKENNSSRVEPVVMLDEGGEQLKNQMYTCCRSGDVTKLSMLLERFSIAQKEKKNTGNPESNPQKHIVQESDTVEPSAKFYDSRTCERAETNLAGSDDQITEEDTNSPESDSQMNSTQFEQTISHRTSDNGMAGPCIAVDNNKEIRSTGVLSPEKEMQLFEQIVLGKYGQKGSSLLHVAASSGHTDIITALLEAGCDPALRDSGGKVAYCIASSKDARNAFRRFRGINPERYDYDIAQIPNALTADMEAERKQKEAVKKKAQKKAKQERLKDRKVEEAKEAAEKREKERFLALSDREKRALAAERRLLAQAPEQASTPVLSRCYQCGTDISGKVPFEYMEFKFCSPKCLKEHRFKQSK